MGFHLDNITTFKEHKKGVESLNNTVLYRVNDINNLIDLLKSDDYIAITGTPGIGKTRLAAEVIENYIKDNPNYIDICLQSFNDYISIIYENIEEDKKYIILIDDANCYKDFDNLFELLKYNNNSNIKVIFTIRNYYKSILDDKIEIKQYKLKPLSYKFLGQIILENTNINNEYYLNQIIKTSNGNVKLALMLSSVIQNDFSGKFTINPYSLISKFYSTELSKFLNDSNLIKSLCIISFFKSIYLDKLFYISPILKEINITKQTFLDSVNTLISLNIVEEYWNVIKINDQCFSEYLLYYFLIDKKYIKISDLLIKYYKYYSNIINDSLFTIIYSTFYDKSNEYIKNEIISSCDNIIDIEIEYEIETKYSFLILDYAVNKYKHGIDNYKPIKNINYLINLFKILANSEYLTIAIKGMFKLLNKANDKECIYKGISEAFKFDSNSIKLKFIYLKEFVNYINANNIIDNHLFELVSSYLSLSFEEFRVSITNEISYVNFNINEQMNGLISFRTLCLRYLFKYNYEIVSKVILKYADLIITKENINIITNDLTLVNDYLIEKPNKDIINTILYIGLNDYLSKYNREKFLKLENNSITELISIILLKINNSESYKGFEIRYKNNIKEYYTLNKLTIFKNIKCIEDILCNYNYNKFMRFLDILIEIINEYNQDILNLFVKYNIFPYKVVSKLINLKGYDLTYNLINDIDTNIVKDEYLYNFYKIVSDNNINNNYGFDKWIYLKLDKETTLSSKRSVISLLNIAGKSNISYLDLINNFYKKRYYNKYIAKTYLVYLFYEENTFKNLAKLDIKLATKIYEFLIDSLENDYNYSYLNEILKLNNNYIKTYAKRFISNYNNYNENLSDVVFKYDYKLFFNVCINELLINDSNTYLMQKFIKDNIKRKELDEWINNYIIIKHNDINHMKLLFKIIANIDMSLLSKYIIKYLEYNSELEVIKCALLSKVDGYSQRFAKEYYENKINELFTLRNKLITWNNVEIINFINDLIEYYKETINNTIIDELIDYVSPSIYKELETQDSYSNISLKEAFDLYINDENFRNMISSGFITYKDNAFITKDNNSLKFIDVLKDRKIYGVKLLPFEPNTKKTYENYLSKVKLIINTFDTNKNLSLDECLISLFNERKWDSNKFYDETLLSRDIFSKINNKKKNKFEKKTLIKILIGLKLTKAERDYLLELNGTPLSIYNQIDVIYSFILDSKLDIYTAEELSEDLNLEII